MTSLLQPMLGLALLTLFAWLLSEDRRQVSPRLILSGLALQFGFALLFFKLPHAKELFLALNQIVLAVQQATQAGTQLVFGYLGGGSAPFTTEFPQNSFVLAFQALPLILVISALSALFFYWGIMPKLVRGFAWILRRIMGTGGPLGLGAAANVFVGMTEAPLLIRPYLSAMSRSALFGLMTCGMATIAGTMMMLYAGIIGPVIPDAMGHILVASLISAPAALMIAGVMVPEQRTDIEDIPQDIPNQDHSSMDAITRGTLDAIPLWLNIIAMLIVMVALVSLVNQLLGWLPEVSGEPLSAQRILGWIMAPIVWLIGIPWSEAPTAGSLMGIKTVLNELVAYLDLAKLPAEALSERSRLIMTYALCGFANLGSLGIMIGGLGAMAPERRGEIVSMGMKSIVAGTLATLMTGAVVGMLL
ncbi:Na+ dependent nucleoside transporter domain protein [Thiorhodococcus drewsii AZ1]|uniref:Na+ dependent nucleoside transporter domain protein n=1 Tax=Thiorhodococcus drewsii AZ1 TaxID=765913 RepID=G2DZG3_9GAMM|nr:nucleoside transporter C-terminal domain-containing protein [Thiorhodococcus drewsii]EGV32190.1 Na+ dependent nucleoside transporter domain protein [Thiorhodococcus drewsii AZ1]